MTDNDTDIGTCPRIPGLEQAQYWARGGRSIVYRGLYYGTPAAIKIKVDESEAADTLLREARALRLVNQWHIGPTLLAASDAYVITKFEFGLHIRQWLPISSPQRIELMFRDLFRQARLLDFLGYSKGELHRLANNLIVGPRDNPILLDFERITPAESPKNITQIAHFLSTRSSLFHELGIHFDSASVTEAAVAYKNARSLRAYNILLDTLFAPDQHTTPCCGCQQHQGSEIEKFRKPIHSSTYSQHVRQESLRRLKKSHDQ